MPIRGVGQSLTWGYGGEAPVKGDSPYPGRGTEPHMGVRGRQPLSRPQGRSGGTGATAPVKGDSPQSRTIPRPFCEAVRGKFGFCKEQAREHTIVCDRASDARKARICPQCKAKSYVTGRATPARPEFARNAKQNQRSRKIISAGVRYFLSLLHFLQHTTIFPLVLRPPLASGTM